MGVYQHFGTLERFSEVQGLSLIIDANDVGDFVPMTSLDSLTTLQIDTTDIGPEDEFLIHQLEHFLEIRHF